MGGGSVRSDILDRGNSKDKPGGKGRGPEAGKRLICGRVRRPGCLEQGSSGRKGTGSGCAGPVGCTEEWDFVLWAIGRHGRF